MLEGCANFLYYVQALDALVAFLPFAVFGSVQKGDLPG